MKNSQKKSMRYQDTMSKHLRKVISGGQTGADAAGVIAAQACGLDTGGWMPKGFKTTAGNRPQWAENFYMKEHSSSSYKERTWDNVREADATIRLAANFNSAGEKCTLNAIKALGKPHLDVDMNNPPAIQEVVKWIREQKVKTLNIAGNSEQSVPGIEAKVQDYLLEVFSKFELT